MQPIRRYLTDGEVDGWVPNNTGEALVSLRVKRAPAYRYPDGVILQLPAIGEGDSERGLRIWVCSVEALEKALEEIKLQLEEEDKESGFPMNLRLKKPLRIWDDDGASYSLVPLETRDPGALTVDKNWREHSFVNVTFNSLRGGEKTATRQFPTRKSGVSKETGQFEDYFEPFDEEVKS